MDSEDDEAVRWPPPPPLPIRYGSRGAEGWIDPLEPEVRPVEPIQFLGSKEEPIRVIYVGRIGDPLGRTEPSPSIKRL